MKSFLSASLIALFVGFASFASAQEKEKPVAAESQRKLSALFATLGKDNTCSKVSNSEAWECSYRGHGLRQISVRVSLIREPVIDADVVLVTSLFAAKTEFPDTPDFLSRLLKFNIHIDFAKLAITDDGRILLLALCPVRLVDKEELTLMLDQVAAANNEAFDAFQKDAKQ
jgi:hypothetical protein